MPKNPFKDNQDFVTKPKRNAFDLSFQNNLTMKLGTLVPVFCKECLPGDSFQIDADFGLKFLPMPFPLQTPMRAVMHFFYVRNRNLWKNWMDFYGMTKEGLVHPYIANNDPDFWRTGSLADYLGVPTTLAARSSISGFGLPYFEAVPLEPGSDSNITQYRSCVFGIIYDWLYHNWYDMYTHDHPVSWPMLGSNTVFCFGTRYDPYTRDPENNGVMPDFLTFDPHTSVLPAIPFDYLFDSPFDSHTIEFPGLGNTHCTVLVSLPGDEPGYSHSRPYSAFGDCAVVEGVLDFASHVSYVNGLIAQFGGVYFTLVFPVNTFEIGSTKNPTTGVLFRGDAASVDDLSFLSTINPFYSGDPDVRLSALPFRAYEQIYNAYYRNVQNDPFLVNNQAEYNKYGTTYEDGPDSTPYHLFQRNWEMDFLTSALPSPQQGMAPLVGVSALGNIQIDDGDNGIIDFQAEVGEDGDTVVGGSWHHPNPSIQARQTMMELITGGFSINDFRNVNSFQRFLETNMRRGLRYKDVVLGHTGVNVKYDELDMPEFIGGFSRPVQVSQVLQSVDQGDSSPLGSYAGNANCFGGSKHSIRHYCDESGFIMGILCIVPQPSYSQLLPKHFLHHETLDYYFPEFGHLGMQPITYEEVAPVQVKLAQSLGSNIRFTDVFGYQRPWYDLLASVDEVHGQMRTTQRDFLMNRLFDGPPELGHDFLAIDPKQTNNVFVMTGEDLDPVQGQIAFRCFVKRAIPRYGIPRLE